MSSQDRPSYDPHNYLSTPARIIAEDDKYAVVAIRIEKEWLRANLHFLAALADATGR
jgi:hypothetical protein